MNDKNSFWKELSKSCFFILVLRIQGSDIIMEEK